MNARKRKESDLEFVLKSFPCFSMEVFAAGIGG